MSLLLDTHTFLWWLSDDRRLSQPAFAAISDPAQGVFVSAATSWEIATKHRIGKLPEATELLADLPGVIRRAGFVEMPITTLHAVVAGQLAGAHRDPFDRMLVAQALCENVQVVTIDDALKALGARCLW